MAKPNLSPDQKAAVSALVTELLKAHTQAEIADACGLSQSTVSHIKLGRQGTTLAVALKLCEFAGVDPATVLGADWAKVAQHDPAGIEGARTLGLSQGFDREWVMNWAPNVVHPETLSVSECWILMQGDWIIRTHEGSDEIATRLREQMAKINSVVAEAINRIDGDMREIVSKKG